jgi:hypothetical protein
MLLLREHFSRSVSENLPRTVFGPFVAGLASSLAGCPLLGRLI